MTKKFNATMPEIDNYDTAYLDELDGHVADFTYEEPVHLPAVRTNVVVPQRAQPNPMSGALAHLMTQQPASNGERDAVAIRHMEMMSERSTPSERSWGKLVQYAGWVAIAGIITVGLNQAGLDSVMAWIVFVCAFGYGVYKVNRDENEHSPAGVERHKTDGYVKIRVAEIKAQDRANARNHATFGRVLDQVYGGDRAQNRITRQR